MYIIIVVVVIIIIIIITTDNKAHEGNQLNKTKKPSNYKGERSCHEF
jgi:hypothetical protein